MTDAFLTGALLGLLASPHCMTMCGPLSWQAQSGIPLRTLPYFTGLYHVGRISLYLVLGSLFWLLVDWAQVPLYAGVAAGAASFGFVAINSSKFMIWENKRSIIFLIRVIQVGGVSVIPYYRSP